MRGTTDHYNTAQQVEEEVRRTAAYSEHVDEPLPPRQLFGTLAVDDLIAMRRKRVAEIRDEVTAKNGTTYTRGLRKDADTLYTEIHSHPVLSRDYIDNPDGYQKEVSRWLKHLARDFVSRMPEGVEFTALMHLDEAHLHVHILAINAADPKLDANKLHAGKRAAAAHREANGSDAIVPLPKPELIARPNKPKQPRPSKNRATQKKNDARHTEAVATWEADCAPIDAENARRMEVWKAENDAHLASGRNARGTSGPIKAYNAAMRQVQDDYYEAVGKPCGLLRHGPRQARKPTKEYKADQEQARHMADEIERMNLQRQEQEARDADLTAREAQQAIAETALAEQRAAHEVDVAAKAKALEDQRAKLARAESEAQSALAAQAKEHREKENELREREVELTEAMVAMGQVLDAVESGEAEVVGGKLRMSKWPKFLQRMVAPAVEDAPSAPVMTLVRRFLQLVVRGREVAQGADGPSVQDDGRGLGA